jgi:signal transduction histidine kinase
LPDAALGLRTPLERLLHALNQPLTGLQCSLEVALAAPRTVEYYEQRLRQGVELAERMRALVEALREVAEGKTGRSEIPTGTDLAAVGREVVEGLELVAEAKRVRIVRQESAGFPLRIHLSRQETASLLFRMIESALTLAEGGSEVRIEMSGCRVIETNAPAAEVQVTMQWQGLRAPEFSRPELGLLVAQAGWERAGATWERERAGNAESVRVRLAVMA